MMQPFMPHGCCYQWNSALIAFHVFCDGAIAIAYYSIPLMLVYFVLKRRDLAFNWIYVCFAIFILACGATHVMEIVDIWHPMYWLTGWIKAVTAVASIGTALLLIKLIPQALALPSPKKLRGMNQELLDKTTQLEKSNEDLEAFTYSVSHDLRAPLRNIHGFAELLRETSGTHLSDEGSLYLTRIEKSSERMGLLIEDLLSFARMARMGLRKVPVPMKPLVDDTVQELMLEADGRDIQWHIPPLPTVNADPTLMKQVWVNLLSNAIKYTQPRAHAEIEIGFRDLPDTWEFFVRDNGVGFDMQYIGKLFGIFERLHANEFEGTGVGLAHVRRIVDRHGGKTWAEGIVNSGATFSFSLPKNG